MDNTSRKLADVFGFPSLDETWKRDAACRGLPVELFFPSKGDALTVRRAVETCQSCPVAAQCLEYCVRSGIHIGVWGGMTERRRRNELDRRNGKVRHQHVHGTNGGYARHMQEGTEVCEPCRTAHRIYKALSKGGDAA